MLLASGFSWFALAFGADERLPLMAHSWLACGLVVLFAIAARIGLNAARNRQGAEAYMAEERLSPRTVAEIVAEAWLKLMQQMLSREDAYRFFPLIGALFFYIFACNVLGVFPGLLPPTDNINTNVGMAIVSFLAFLWVGLSRDAAGFIKHMMGPMIYIAPMVFGLEAMGLVLRPVTLSLRLTGNMFGDHTVLNIMSGLFGWLLPVPFLGLAIFVSFMQAFVFSLLTYVYIGLSVPHDSHEHH